MITTARHLAEDDCVSILVRVAREAHVEAEHLRARELLRQAASTWAGYGERNWSKWLSEAGASLGIHSRVATLTLSEALHLSQDGALLVGRAAGDDGKLVLVTGFNGTKVRLAVGDLDHQEETSVAQFQSQLGLADEQTGHWLIIDTAAKLPGRPAAGETLSPLKRLVEILRPEWSDIWTVMVFAFFVGVLSLATPIAAEALVNTVAFGRFVQPVVVLSVMLFVFLSFAAAVVGLQTFVVEIIQRRLFARVVADLAYRLPRVRHESWDAHYAPELVNRFFEVTTLQKVAAYMLLDGVALVQITLVGLGVLAFYHPWLLGFDVILVGLVVSGVWILGRGAIGSGIEESKYKYRVASWLEDIARCPRTFKLDGAAEFAGDRANYLTSQYLSARRSHFKILMRQILFVLGLQAVAGTVLLGFGGWLVIEGQLTLGQLVAAELIVATVLGAMAKFGKHLEGYYDLLAGVDKLGKLLDLPLERHDGLLELDAQQVVSLRLTDVNYAFERSNVYRSPLRIELAAGERLAVAGSPGAGKSLLLELLYGLRRPSAGHVEVCNVDPADARPDALRRHVSLVRRHEFFEGTLIENVQVHRPLVSLSEVRAALADVGLLEDALRLKDGLETQLLGDGVPLTGTQKTLLMLARAMAGAPRLLLIDGLLDRLPDEDLQRVLAALADRSRDSTLVVVTGRREVREWCNRCLELQSPHEGAATMPSEEGDS